MMQLPEETFEMDSIRKLCSFPLLSDTYPTEETVSEQILKKKFEGFIHITFGNPTILKMVWDLLM